MLNSNLLYVGASRAEEKLFQIGEPMSLPPILAVKANLKRKTNLPELLNKKNRDKILTLYTELVSKMEEEYNESITFKKEQEKRRIEEEKDKNKNIANEILEANSWDSIPF